MKRNFAVRSRANLLPASHHPGGSWELLTWDPSISPCRVPWPRVWVSKANSSDTLQSKELLGLFSGLWRRERWRACPSLQSQARGARSEFEEAHWVSALKPHMRGSKF